MQDLLVILPTPNTLFRFEKEGVLQSLKEEAKRGIKIRMLIQGHNTANSGSSNNNDNNNSTIKEEKIIQGLTRDSLIDVQHLDKLSNTKLIIIISDTRLSLAIEVKSDNSMTTNEAIGLATHSNSESTVLTYISIFETLWTQAELRPSAMR